MNAKKNKNKDYTPQLNKQLQYHSSSYDDDKVITIRRFHIFMYEMGKFLVDIAKLVFAGVILAGIMNEDIDHKVLFLTGSIAVILFAIIGSFIVSKNKEVV